MDLLLKGKIVIVTEGAEGIGAAIVKRLMEEDAVPVIVDSDVDAARRLEENLRGGAVAPLLICADLSDAEKCSYAIEETIRRCGRLDTLVNYVSVYEHVGLESGSPEQYIESVKRNLLRCYNMAHYALPHVKKSQGCILNVSSKTANGKGETSGDASSKGAILALTREWAVELLQYSIRVNAIVPAAVVTPIYEPSLDAFANPQEKRKAIAPGTTVAKRMSTAEEIAAMAAFLISPRASHVTGQHVFVDGAWAHSDPSAP